MCFKDTLKTQLMNTTIKCNKEFKNEFIVISTYILVINYLINFYPI